LITIMQVRTCQETVEKPFSYYLVTNRFSTAHQEAQI
jgi:hypothetical protein